MLHIGVEELVRKPPGLEALTSGIGVSYTMFTPKDRDLHIMPALRNLTKMIE